MTLNVYALGGNLVAAATPAAAAAVMARYEEPGRWSEADARKLAAADLAEPVDDSSDTTIKQALERANTTPRSRLDTAAGGVLIRWDFPSA